MDNTCVSWSCTTRASKEDLGNVLVLGLGKSGRSVARYCADLLGTRVQSVFVAAGQENRAAREFLEDFSQEGFAFAFGDDGVPKDRTFDICIASPGIPFWHDLYLAGQQVSKELISEMEFAWRESKPNSIWVAITGTNGKTTVTSLSAHILKHCGYAAEAVGNIGDVCLDAVAAGGTDIYVAEVSSYQLASTSQFAPDVAVILNITPDHLHWHKTLEAYRDAKFKVLENLGSVSPLQGNGLPVAVLNAVDDQVRARIRELRQISVRERGFAYIPIGTADGIKGDMRKRCGAENAAYLNEEGHLVVGYAQESIDLGPATDLQILGEHNVSNALAAASVAFALGADAAKVREALRAFKPLEHRIEPCGEIDGVLYVNDSKGTNVDAVLKALTAFPGRTIVLLLGGEDKGTDLEPLVQAVLNRVRVAICYGEAGPRFKQAFAEAKNDAPQGFVCKEARHMADALGQAVTIAQPGEVVLLSPACASFDEFSCFEERGLVFKKMIEDYMARSQQAIEG